MGFNSVFKGLIKKFHAFYEIRRSTRAIFKRIRHLSLFWASSIQSTPPSHILKNYFNIILPFTPRSFPKVSLSNAYTHLPSPRTCHMSRPPPPSCSDHPNTWWEVEIAKLLVQSHFTSSLLGSKIFLNALFSNTLIPCSSISMRDQVSHPRTTIGIICVL